MPPLHKQLGRESDEQLLERVGALNEQVEQDNFRLGTNGHISRYSATYARLLRQEVVARELHKGSDGERFCVEVREGDRFDPSSSYCKRVEKRRAKTKDKIQFRTDRQEEIKKNSQKKEEQKKYELIRNQRELQNRRNPVVSVLHDYNDYLAYIEAYEDGLEDDEGGREYRGHMYANRFGRQGYSDGYEKLPKRYRFEQATTRRF